MNNVKYKTQLLTGEVVNEFVDSVPLKQVETHCPRKWALVDLQSGHVYGWREDGSGYISPPSKSDRILNKAVREMMKKPKKKKEKK